MELRFFTEEDAPALAGVSGAVPVLMPSQREGIRAGGSPLKRRRVRRDESAEGLVADSPLKRRRVRRDESAEGLVADGDAAPKGAIENIERSRPLTHFDSYGEVAMVDVGAKQPTIRCAVAGCKIQMKNETLELLRSGVVKKGDAFTVAKVAGILAAKKTHELVPLCHPLFLEVIEIRFSEASDRQGILIEAEVRTTAKTGVEMEALTAVAVAALTLYDMVKGYDPGMVIHELHLVRKTGGKSDYLS